MAGVKIRHLVCKAEVRRLIQVKALERGITTIKQIDPEVFGQFEAMVVDQVESVLQWYRNYGKRRPRLRKYGHRYK